MPYKLPYFMGSGQTTDDQIYAAKEYSSYLIDLFDDLRSTQLLMRIAVDELDIQGDTKCLIDKLEVLIRTFCREYDSVYEIIEYCLLELKDILDIKDDRQAQRDSATVIHEALLFWQNLKQELREIYGAPEPQTPPKPTC